MASAKGDLCMSGLLCPGRSWWKEQVRCQRRKSGDSCRYRSLAEAPCLHDGVKQLQRYSLSLLDGLDPLSGDDVFHVTVSMLSGKTRCILGLRPCDRLVQLLERIGTEFEIPPSQIQVSVGSDLLSRAQLGQRLKSLGIRKGHALTCIRQDAHPGDKR
eukprot:TRINITY_DN15001_c6_g1_i1.p1 TRINITY_DN15001_c6_g1~~TRINITY_DN15001_c6_g1_i1.p1  ORF type:complete len:169 (+),score=11.78 TRINITY_DN15001_c6_g1_i1:35-508(+)